MASVTPLRKHQIFVSLVSPRTRVLVICSKAERTNHSREVLSEPPLTYYLFLKTVEKGATTLVLFAYAMYAMLYLLLPSGALLHVAFGCLYSVLYLAECLAKQVVHASLAVNANPESALEYGRISFRVA